MGTEREQLEAIRHSVEVARRKLGQLDGKEQLSRPEQFEREMTVSCIERGERLLTEWKRKLEPEEAH